MKKQKNVTQAPVRIDKWLWATRCYKTRSLARAAVQGGKIKYNGQQCKPSKTVDCGAIIRFPVGFDFMEIEVLEISDKRVSAPLAQKMYRETSESELKREQNAEARRLSSLLSPHPVAKPGKKERRDILRLKGRE